MLHTFVRVVLIAALVAPLAACKKQASSAPAPGLAPLAPDPEQEAKKSKEATYRVHLANGVAALGLGQYDSALEALNRALGEKPNGAEAHLALARVYMAKNDEDAALKEYAEAANANPQLVEARMERAAIFERHGKLNDAEAEYRQVISAGTDKQVTARAYWLRGAIMDRQGKRGDYRYYCDEAIKLDPTYQKQVNGGDVKIANHAEVIITVRIDLLVEPDGTERTFPPELRFTVRGDTSAFLTYKNQILTARSVKFTIINQDGAKQFTVTYKGGMTLEIPIYEQHVPKAG
jgi:tetratricopeptide (TPR) repeat protein